MKKLFFGLHVCAVLAASALVVHCSSTDTRPDAGTTDRNPEGGTSSGTSGSSGGNELLVEPPDVNFGDNGFVNCGASAPPQTVTFTNNSTTPRQFKGKLTAGAEHYTLSPDVVTVLAGKQGTMQVVPTAIPTKSAVTPELYSGSLEITALDQGSTSAGTTLTNVRLHQTARGAIVKSTLGATPTINFGGVKIGTTSNQTFSLTNTGNASIDLGFAVGSPAFNPDPKTTTLAANGTAVTTIAFSPTLQQAYTDTLVVSNPKAAATCDDLPGQTTLTATGTLSVGTAPGSLAFGLVDCGATALYKTVTITNDGAAMQFAATLGKGAASPYSLADNTGGAITLNQQVPVGAATTYVLRVVPKAVTPPVLTTVDGLGDTLTITTNSPGDAPHVVQLTETARGAFVALDKAQYTIVDNRGAGFVLGTNITLSNTGNLPVSSYTINVAGRPGVPTDTFKLLTTSGSLAAPQNQVIVLETKVPTAWPMPAQLIGDISVNAQAAVLCSGPQPTAPVYYSPQ